MTTNLVENLESRDPNKRWEGVKEAVRIQAVELLPRLCAMMESEQDEFVLCGLLTAVGQLGGAAHSDRIGGYLCDPRAIVRETALYALDLTNDAYSVRHVFGALEDSAPAVKQTAHQIAGRFPPESLQKIAEEMLLSGISWQEDNVLTALRRLESFPPNFFLELLGKSRNPGLLCEILKIVATRVECTAEVVLKLTDLRSGMPEEVQEEFDAVLDLLNSRISEAERIQVPSIDPSDPDLSRGKIGLLERIGEQVVVEKDSASVLSPAVKAGVERIGQIDAALAEKGSRIAEGLKKEIGEGGFWDKTKQSVSKWGNIGKLKLEVGGLSAERSSCLVRIGAEILSLWNKKESLPAALSTLAQKAAYLEEKDRAEALNEQERSEEFFEKVRGAAKDLLKKGSLLSEAARKSRQFLLQEKLKLQAETLRRQLDLKCERLGSMAYGRIVGSPPVEFAQEIKEITALSTHRKLTEAGAEAPQGPPRDPAQAPQGAHLPGQGRLSK
ncbi:MAG: hypothetical protein HYU64_12905 [Armatimonadetes bacterium]|nr:hypothetical protein [Armatimonadota bacterium]